MDWDELQISYLYVGCSVEVNLKVSSLEVKVTIHINRCLCLVHTKLNLAFTNIPTDIIFTDHVRSTRESNVYSHVCVSVCLFTEKRSLSHDALGQAERSPSLQEGLFGKDQTGRTAQFLALTSMASDSWLRSSRGPSCQEE